MNSSETEVYTCLHPKQIYYFGPPESYYGVTIPVCVINIILMVFIIFGNVAVILAYCWNRSLQNIPNMLLITLAISDTVVGVLAQPLFIIKLIRAIFDLRPLCALETLSSIANMYCAGVSMLTLSLVISSERYLAIVHPFKHRRLVTKNKIKLVIVFLWSTLFLLNCVLFLGISYKVYFLILSALIPVGFIVTAFASYSILKKWKTSRSRQASVNSALGGSPSAIVSVEKKNFKIAKTMFYIVGAIALCYSPLLAALLYGQIKEKNWIYLKYLYPNGMTLVYLNSLLNPIIYCLRNQSFTRAILKMIGFDRREQTRRARCYTIDQPLSHHQNVDS